MFVLLVRALSALTGLNCPDQSDLTLPPHGPGAPFHSTRRRQRCAGLRPRLCLRLAMGPARLDPDSRADVLAWLQTPALACSPGLPRSLAGGSGTGAGCEAMSCCTHPVGPLWPPAPREPLARAAP